MDTTSLPVTPRSPVRTFYADEFERNVRYTNWRPQGSGDWLLVYTLHGGGRIGNGDGEEHAARPGDLVLFEKDTPQFYATDPEVRRWHFLWTHCSYLPLRDFILHWGLPLPGVRTVTIKSKTMHQRIASALREVIRQARSSQPLGVELGFNALERVMLLARQTLAEAESDQQLDPRIERAVAILSEELKGPLDIDGLAERVGLSPSRFYRLFHAQTAQTPRQFAEERRLHHAAQLLRLTLLPIQEVATACGFSCPYYFSNRFRQRHDVSPSRYRKGT